MMFHVEHLRLSIGCHDDTMFAQHDGADESCNYKDAPLLLGVDAGLLRLTFGYIAGPVGHGTRSAFPSSGENAAHS